MAGVLAVVKMLVFASSQPSAYQWNVNRATFVFFWLTGVAFGGVLGFASVMLAYSDASAKERPHPPPTLAPMAPPEEPLSQGPGYTIRSPEMSTAPVVATQPQQHLSFAGFNHTVCYTPSCVSLARGLRHLLNPLVDPCDNFQEHVCGRYESERDSLLDNYIDIARKAL
ncbi:uncharacterized protein LOC125946315 [Dermacentor silvarum]|uniref:uncharacterized protein LOC125946315 n=1 Tax=Dermacentor silvarum TaxID=543639 RepID=UPI0021007110|nr:uncharacterized protein LOC125946315 [Dermacentor silvarum]